MKGKQSNFLSQLCIIKLICLINIYSFSQKPKEIASIRNSCLHFNEYREFKIDGNFKLIQTQTFINECQKPNNDLLSNKFLRLPDSISLKVIYVINKLNQLNTIPSKKKTLSKFVDSLLLMNIEKPIMVDNYYRMLFSSVGSDIISLSKSNIYLDSLNLNNDFEKSILYLRCIELCEKHIWGYFYMSSPPNFEKTILQIKNYPKINNQEYFLYTNFDFKDIFIEIYNEQEPQSYKKELIGKLYNILYAHIISMINEGEESSKLLYLWNNSILSHLEYYHFTNLKSELQKVESEIKN